MNYPLLAKASGGGHCLQVFKNKILERRDLQERKILIGDDLQTMALGQPGSRLDKDHTKLQLLRDIAYSYFFFLPSFFRSS